MGGGAVSVSGRKRGWRYEKPDSLQGFVHRPGATHRFAKGGRVCRWYGQAMNTQIDHLVVVASTLAQGVHWAEQTLGIVPGPGGEHVQFGTHNRLFKIATPSFAWAYLEIIAIDPQAARRPQSPRVRWFDMDDAHVQAAVAVAPRLVHFVANTTDIHAAHAALNEQGIDRGAVMAASRDTARGMLHWQITVRDDGRRLLDGVLPSLIQWGRPGDKEPMQMHPRNSLPRSRVSLHGLAVMHPEAQRLKAAYAAIGLTGIPITPGPANLCATLRTPRGEVTLQSLGL